MQAFPQHSTNLCARRWQAANPGPSSAPPVLRPLPPLLAALPPQPRPRGLQRKHCSHQQHHVFPAERLQKIPAAGLAGRQRQQELLPPWWAAWPRAASCSLQQGVPAAVPPPSPPAAAAPSAAAAAFVGPSPGLHNIGRCRLHSEVPQDTTCCLSKCKLAWVDSYCTGRPPPCCHKSDHDNSMSDNAHKAAACLGTRVWPGRCGGQGRQAARAGCGVAPSRCAHKKRVAAATSCAAGRPRCCAQRAPPAMMVVVKGLVLVRVGAGGQVDICASQ